MLKDDARPIPDSALLRLTALEAGSLVRRGELQPADLAGLCLDRIAAREPDIHAFIQVSAETAAAHAGQAARQLATGSAPNAPHHPLAGVPMAVKDNICTAGLATTCGSHMLAGYQPPYDATAWARLRASGAVLLGKLNMDEFAMGSTSETSWFGAVRNPLDTGRIAGGSSGGSAAAVASGEAFYALGSDTGGSVRQPAAYCGVTGFKPTYGRVSRYGLVAFASSLDQIGPIARDALSCAAVLAEMAGPDGMDSTALPALPGDILATVGGFSLAGLRVGLPDELFGDGIDPAVRGALMAAARQFADCGASVESMHLAGTDLAVPAYYVIACAEAASNLSRYDGVKYGYRPQGAADLSELYERSRSEGFGTEVRRRLLLGNFVLSSGFFDAYYRRAVRARERIADAFADAFRGCDLLLCPVTPDTAPLSGASAGDPLSLYLKDLYTVMPNLAGLPAISLPCGHDEAGMPVGLQLIGRHGADLQVLGAAHAFQRATDFHRAIGCQAAANKPACGANNPACGAGKE